MNPFSPPPGQYPSERRPAERIPVPDERPPARRNASEINGHPRECSTRLTTARCRECAGRRPFLPAPAPAREKRMILPVLGGGFVGAVVLAAVIALQGPQRYPAPAQADLTPVTNAADQVGFREAGTLSALDLQAGDCYNTGQLPPAPGTKPTPISTVEAVPCASPHTDQVMAKVVYSPTDTLADVRANRAGHGLRGRTAPEGRLRHAHGSRLLGRNTVPADDTTWTAGHTIACVVMSDGPRTGSALESSTAGLAPPRSRGVSAAARVLVVHRRAHRPPTKPTSPPTATRNVAVGEDGRRSARTARPRPSSAPRPRPSPASTALWARPARTP